MARHARATGAQLRSGARVLFGCAPLVIYVRRPRGWRRSERHGLAAHGMLECDFERMQTQRRCVDAERLHFADFTAGDISRIAAHGPTEMCEMNSNLVGATGSRTRFEQGGAILKPTQNAKVGVRRQSGDRIDT